MPPGSGSGSGGVLNSVLKQRLKQCEWEWSESGSGSVLKQRLKQWEWEWSESGSGSVLNRVFKQRLKTTS